MVSRIAVLLVLAVPAGAEGLQRNPQGVPQECGCLADFTEAVRVIEENYVGLALAPVDRRAVYQRQRDGLLDRARGADSDACLELIRELTGFFDDGHLFVIDAPRTDSAAMPGLMAQRERLPLTEGAVRAYLDTNRGRVDPVEGIWYDQGLRVAVVRDEGSGPAAAGGTRRDFVAVVLSSDDPRWQPGMVRAELRRQGELYETVLWGGDHSRRRPYPATLKRNGAVLHMPPTLWGRAYPLFGTAHRRLDRTDPRAPTFHRVDPQTVIITIPSQAPQHVREPLRQIVAEHHAEIVAAEVLILDVRGNEGGSSLATRILAPYYASERLRPPLLPDNGPPALLASTDHIEEAEANVRKNPDLPAAVLAVVDEMRERQGALVRLPAELFSAQPFRPDSLYPGPERVVVLIDRHTMSAAEAFVLEAARSARVVLMGENTAGVIDFQNVKVRPLACLEHGRLLGYPEYAAGHVLSGHFINARGIEPHVRIDPEVVDWVRFAAAHAGARGSWLR